MILVTDESDVSLLNDGFLVMRLDDATYLELTLIENFYLKQLKFYLKYN